MDRTTRGFYAGIIAGIAMNVWNLFDYYLLHISEIRFLDWFSVLATWDKPKTWFQTVFFLVLQIVLWDGVLGVVFAHSLVWIKSKGIVYKSTIYSLFLWFLFKIAVNFYHAPVLSGRQNFSGVISNFLAVVLWGIILGLVLTKLEEPVVK